MTPVFISGVDEGVADGEVARVLRGSACRVGVPPELRRRVLDPPGRGTGLEHLNTTVRGGMDRRRFELVTIAAARARGSTYCTVAHAAFLRDVCGDATAVESIAEHPDGAGLSAVDLAVYTFAVKVAKDASSVEQTDVDGLRAAGLSDADVADVVFAVAARCFFTAVLDGLGAQLDVQTAQTFAPAVLESMVVGRPVAGS